MLSGLRILLAEDNPTNQLVASQMLESLGATVALAEDGVEALEQLGREPFDVVLVDIEMPRINGIELIRRVRSGPAPLANLPMIALTAYVMREHRAAIDAAGADGVIAKPILSIEQFGADIRRFMRKRSGASGSPAATGAVAGDAGATASVVDRDIYDALAEAIGPAAMSELLEKVVADLGHARQRLERALEPIDMGEIRTVTHILISVAGAVGAVPLQMQAKRVNEAAHRDETDTVRTDAGALLGLIDGVLEHVQSQAEG